MGQSLAGLTNLGQGYAPMAEGIAHNNRTGFEGLPFAGQGPLGALAQMAAMQQLQQSMGRTGMLPVGVGHDQNVYDTMKSMQFSQMQMQAMRTAAESDRATYMNLARGAATLSGRQFGHEQYRAANTVIDPLIAASPYAAQFAPEWLDQMGGRRGSATVMAHRMIDAGRYRVDPVTGRMGMSGESVGLATRSLFADMFNDNNIAKMQGMTAGQAGSLFGELQKRGMMRASELDPQSQMRQAVQSLANTGDLTGVARRQGVSLAGGVSGLSGADIDKLGLDTAVGDKLRSFDAEKIKRTLKNYTGAMSAMRDIFGDAGKPNAPMAELVQGLEALTAGSMGKIDPQRLGQIAKQTYNLSKQAGVTLDSAMMMQGDLAQRGQAMGLESIFAVKATQGALAFGSAYDARGQGAYAAWGAKSSDQIKQLDGALRMQAAGSNAANRLNVAMRVRDTMGGFAKGSDAYALTEAVAAGLDTYKDSTGSVRSVAVSEKSLIGMLTSAKGANGQSLGLTEADIRDFSAQRGTSREYGERYGTADIVRRRQGADEIIPFLGNQMQNVLRSKLTGIAGDAGAREAAKAVSQRAVRQIMAMDREGFADTQTRNKTIAGILEKELAGTGAGAALRGMSASDRQAFLLGTADQFYGRGNEALRRSHLRGIGNLQDVHAVTSQATLDMGDANAMKADLTGKMQEAMAPLGRGTLTANVVEALGDVDPNDPDAAAKIVARAVGGVASADVSAAMVGPAQAVAQQKKAIEAIVAKLAKEKDPTARANLMKQLDSAKRTLTGQVNDLNNFAKKAGLAPAGVGASDLQRASAASRAVLNTQADLSVVRTGRVAANADQFPASASPEAIKAAKPWFSKMSDDQAETLVNARNRAGRAGISAAMIKAHGGDELGAIDSLLEGQEMASYSVSDADRSPYLGVITDAQRAAFLKVNPQYKGASKTAINNAIADKTVLGKRADQRRGRFDAFWKSSDGARFRDEVSGSQKSQSDIAQGLIATPAAIRKMGTRALELHETMTADQGRLDMLAKLHSGGDVARLMAGDLNANTANPAAIRQETFAIQRRQAQITAELHDRESKLGKTWRPDKEEAMRLLGFRPGTSLTPSQQREVDKLSQDVGLARRLTPAQEASMTAKDPKALAKLASELGVDSAALGRAGGVLDKLTAMQGAALGRNSEAGQDVANRIFTAFGLKHPSGMVTAQQRELGSLIESGGGRNFARQILASQETLQMLAARGGGKGNTGIDAMVAEYASAMDGDPKGRQNMISAFQLKYGMAGKDGAGRWNALQKAISFQKQTDFLRFGGEGRKMSTDEEALKLFKGEMVPRSPGSNGPGSTAFNGEIKGELRIVGDKGNLVAAMGGTRGAVVS